MLGALVLVLNLLGVIHSGIGQIISNGQCATNVDSVTNFNTAAYLGRWFLIESYPSDFQSGTCNDATYSFAADGSTINVFNTQVINQALNTITGSAVVAAGGAGSLEVTFPNIPQSATIQVLATDYTSYALVYSCVNINANQQAVSSWKLSRTRTLSAAANTAINAVINTISALDNNLYQTVDHSAQACFYFPEPDAATPVRFRGRCNQNINAVPNFDIQRYQGLWHLIESYPSRFQTGTCNNARYMLGSNGLVVQNTHVIDKNLATATGQAVLASIDGSGILDFTFPNSNVPMRFLVLATDYDSYALAYSCVEEDDEYSQVWSWKMSRTRQLSAAAVAAINAVTANIQVLDDRYYQVVDQTPTGCFYFVDQDPSRPVKFRGRCSQNNNAVQNFNTEKFMGLWHLIESYPSNFQTGTCNNARYTLGRDGFVMLNSQVISRSLATRNLFALAASTDGSGVFNIALFNPNETVPYRILATDYESYALVYTCVEEDDEYSQVWSWKFSRTQALSANAVTAINAVTANIQELNARNYRLVDQTPTGCFHFFDPQPGVPVTFPGSCSDTSVPIVDNFNMTQFAGIWHEVESYPTHWREGQCVTHFTRPGGGMASTRSTQVIDQESVVTTGTLLYSANGRGTLYIRIDGTIVVISISIVATDYTDFALVYGCRDRAPGQRTIYSWKLSRQPDLSINAKIAIKSTMASIDVLDQRYYERIDHSSDACFTLPDFTPGVPVIFPGQCDKNIPVVQNFATSRFSRLWFMIESYPSNFQRGGCNEVTFTFNTDGSLTMVNTQVVNERRESITGRVVVASDDGSARLQITFPHTPTPVEVLVLATNYLTYALLYSCENINESQRRVTAWKLGRERTFTPPAAAAIDEVVNSIDVLSDRYFVPIARNDVACLFFPEWDALPNSVVLPGACDTSIRGMRNFNRGLFMGRWFEIERYPQPFQTGQCNRVEYTSSDTTIGVTNSQVVNGTLQTISGVAAVSDVDNHSELLITFNVGGTIRSSNVLVVISNYFTFALLYSCRNLANGNREVSSWKLGRNTSFTTTDINAINRAIANTQGLRQDLYTVTDQSEEACFFVPEVNADQPVLFRGNCPNLSGQVNFDIQRYLGWWHHINNFPTGEDTGTCLSTQYQQSGNQIEFEETQVFGLTGVVTRGTVTASTDGKLVKTWNDGNSSQEITVVATDYETYSLVFSCAPVDNEFVKVWSSMQSKARSLTPAAEQAITEVTAGNDFLRRDLFLAVNQSEEACFHYPETTNRVIFPGQCDEVIPTQADFDIAAYSGIWYQIERYPYPEVNDSSTCIGSRLTNNTDGSVTILHWEVLDGQLNTLEGEVTIANDNAVLEVTLPDDDNGTSQARLYILTTDYTSYALVYTCENINDFERAVVAIKLSRSRWLTSSAATSIENYMASREELHQPLFISVEHFNDCEEPNSSYLFRSSIFLILICYALNMLM